MVGAGARHAPLLVTAQMPPDIFSWADGLRRAHFPSERNRIAAHVTLFHGLPPSGGQEIRAALASAASSHAPPSAQIMGVMPLGGGTALKVVSPAMTTIRRDLAELFHGMLSSQDSHPLVLHITVQNKVSVDAAKALQAMLEKTLKPRKFAFSGLALHAWRDGLWDFMQEWRFRGAKGG